MRLGICDLRLPAKTALEPGRVAPVGPKVPGISTSALPSPRRRRTGPSDQTGLTQPGSKRVLWALRSGGSALLLIIVAMGCSSTGGGLPAATGPTTAPAASNEESPQAAWKVIAQTLGKAGELRDGVYTVTFPRDDITVRIEGMDVPTAAGIESSFKFYQCSCGKTVVLGQFVLPDYEANDVAYALQKQDILISSMGPYLLYEKPRLMVVRFQAEGKAQLLASAIKSAIEWTGKNRMPPMKLTP